jgi:probable rRNA maturation factor
VAGAIEVVDRYARSPDDRELAARAAQAARRFAGVDVDVVVLLTDDAEIAELHLRHLGDAAPTDVMSFATDGAVEVVVSVEYAERQAHALGSAREVELALYVVHGVLHACGHDDRERDERARMRAAERTVLASIGMRVARFE